MNNIKGLSKGVSLVSVEFNTAVKYVTRKGFVNDFPITFEYDFEEYLRAFVGFQQRDDYTILKVDGTDCVRFNKDLVEGVSVTIRHITPSGAVPHVYQYTGNAQGGAEFSAKTMDENFEYMSKIVSEVEDYNTIAQDSLSDMEDKFKKTQEVANNAKDLVARAVATAENAEQVALGIDGKAQQALDKSQEALNNSETALTTALGINGKAQEALDKSTTASQDASVALSIATGIDGKAQEALDKSREALNSIPTDYVQDQEFAELTTRVDNKRDIDDNVFDGHVSIKSDGTVKGRMSYGNDGLQIEQVGEDGVQQTFMMPHESGRLVVDKDLNNKVIIVPTRTVKIPTDYDTISDAIISNFKYITKLEIIIESGHRPEVGAVFSGVNLNNVTISSEDSVVMLDSKFDGRFISVTNGFAPRLNCYISGRDALNLDRIYSLSNAVGYVASGAGGEFTKGRPLYGNNSILSVGGSVWKNCADQMYFSAGSSVQAGNMWLDGFTVTSNGSLTISRGSSMEAQGLRITNCYNGVELKRAGASLNAHGATISNIATFVCRITRRASASFDGSTITDCQSNVFEVYGGELSFAENASITSGNGVGIGVVANAASSVNVGSSTIDGFADNIESRESARVSAVASNIINATRHGVFAHRGGSVSLHSASVQGSSENDLRIQQGGIIYSGGCSTTNSTGSNPSLDDTNVKGFGGFNSIAQGARGIIWT